MIKLMLVCLVAMGMVAALSAEEPPLEVVPSVDLERYLGTWYEIAATTGSSTSIRSTDGRWSGCRAANSSGS
jgi:lipocalin